MTFEFKNVFNVFTEPRGRAAEQSSQTRAP